MKNRSTKILIIAIFILIATIGCTNDNSKNIESKLSSIGDKIEKDDIYVIPEKVNYTFYEKFSIMHSFSIDFLSSSEMTCPKSTSMKYIPRLLWIFTAKRSCPAVPNSYPFSSATALAVT
jgi:hypothetical protein